jgi:hypothetical protein
MSNQEAIALLRNIEDVLDSYCELNEEGKTAFRTAIEALELFGNSEQLPSVQPEKRHGRIFQGIVVEYLSYNTYPEYIGKPYFSIKYTEKGQEFIGYGTYKPEVLSEFLKEYFIPSTQPKSKERTAESSQNVPKEDLISRKAAIDAISIAQDELHNAYSVGLIRAKKIISELPSAQPEAKGAIKALREILDRAKAEAPEDHMLVDVSVPVYIAEALAYSQQEHMMEETT